MGLGLTIAGIAAFIAAYPMGKLVDRFGPKRCWAVSAAGQASLFTLWPFIDSFSGYVAMAVVMEVVGSLGGAAYGAYTIDVLPADERVGSRAYMYSALNVGFTLGARSVASHWPSTPTSCSRRSRGSPRSPSWSTPRRSCACPTRPTTTRPSRSARPRSPGPGPLRNVGWMSSTFFVGVLWTNQVLLNLVIPLWLVKETDAPTGAARLPVRHEHGDVHRAADGGGPRRHRRHHGPARDPLLGAFFVISCLITAYTHDTVGWVTIALVWLGHVTVTGAELYLSAASWSFEAELMDPRRRGEYQGAAELSGTLGRVWAPALYTFLAIS